MIFPFGWCDLCYPSQKRWWLLLFLAKRCWPILIYLNKDVLSPPVAGPFHISARSCTGFHFDLIMVEFGSTYARFLLFFFFFKDQRLVHMNSASRHINSKKEWTVIFHTFKNYFATVFSVFSKISCIQMDPMSPKFGGHTISWFLVACC